MNKINFNYCGNATLNRHSQVVISGGGVHGVIWKIPREGHKQVNKKSISQDGSGQYNFLLKKRKEGAKSGDV